MKSFVQVLPLMFLQRNTFTLGIGVASRLWRAITQFLWNIHVSVTESGLFFRVWIFEIKINGFGKKWKIVNV